jgi:hypothetical protein
LGLAAAFGLAAAAVASFLAAISCERGAHARGQHARCAARACAAAARARTHLERSFVEGKRRGRRVQFWCFFASFKTRPKNEILKALPTREPRTPRQPRQRPAMTRRCADNLPACPPARSASVFGAALRPHVPADAPAPPRARFRVEPGLRARRHVQEVRCANRTRTAHAHDTRCTRRRPAPLTPPPPLTGVRHQVFRGRDGERPKPGEVVRAARHPRRAKRGRTRTSHCGGAAAPACEKRASTVCVRLLHPRRTRGRCRAAPTSDPAPARFLSRTRTHLCSQAGRAVSNARGWRRAGRADAQEGQDGHRQVVCARVRHARSLARFRGVAVRRLRADAPPRHAAPTT